jgi:hypothetical protein
MKFFPTLVLVSALSLLAGSARAGIIDYGTADPFAVLGEAGVTNTGPSLIYGSLAGSTGTPSVTGFPPGAVEPPGVLYTTGVANSGPGTPFGDASAASLYADGLHGINEGTVSLGAGGLSSLTPGVYSFTSTTVLLNGTLQLDAGGSDDASWVFQIPFALTTGSGSNVEVVDTGSAGLFTGSITWVVGSAATLGTDTTFLGTIISGAGSVLQTGATVGCGRVVSLTASVTLDDNLVDAFPADCAVTGGGAPIIPPAPIPEPGTFMLLSSGLLAMVFPRFRKSR